MPVFSCHTVSIIPAIVEPDFWSSPMWIAYGIGLVLSLEGTILGVI